MTTPDASRALIVPSELEEWNLPSKTWLQVNDKHFHGLASAALVFHTFPPIPAGGDTGAVTGSAAADGVKGDETEATTRVLLLQRAPHDSMPLRWEPPGGAVDPEDVSILEGCARELLEEAGLHAARFVRIVERPGDVMDVFTNRTGIKILRRFTFHVEVHVEGEANDVEGGQKRAPVVKLDPLEHVDWYWASREEVEREQRESGEKLPITSKAAKEILMRGFDLRES